MNLILILKFVKQKQLELVKINFSYLNDSVTWSFSIYIWIVTIVLHVIYRNIYGSAIGIKMGMVELPNFN